ncbi:MAG: AzlC family ABC transporter permease [Clostridiales bacterium]|nr:AzlC family ABC transporter permease [Clostridiales bacterium]
MRMGAMEWYRRGLRDGIPIGLGYLAVSFTLGIAARSDGLTAVQATVMSLLNLTSAGQFAGLTVIAAGASYLEMAASQLIINLRYLLMSCALSQKIAPETPMWQRLALGYTITDEIFGISVGAADRLNPFYSFGAVSVAAPGWALGTCLGVILGNVLPARIVSALSVALYAMFLAVILPPARRSRVLAGVVVLSMAASLLFSRLPVLSAVSSGMKIIVLTVLIAGGAALLFPVKEEADA